MYICIYISFAPSALLGCMRCCCSHKWPSWQWLPNSCSARWPEPWDTTSGAHCCKWPRSAWVREKFCSLFWGGWFGGNAVLWARGWESQPYLAACFCHLLRFYRILQDSIRWYRILWDFIGFYRILWDCIGLYIFLQDFIGLYTIV